MSKFENELRALINRQSKENGSNTPDFILAKFLNECLSAFDKAVNERHKWYRPDLTPTIETPTIESRGQFQSL